MVKKFHKKYWHGMHAINNTRKEKNKRNSWNIGAHKRIEQKRLIKTNKKNRERV
jgi:hypothetical protein